MAVRSPERTRLRRPLPTATDLVAVAAGGALVASLVLPADHIEEGPVLCPFRFLTGLPCPGCGMTRAWVYAAHGRLEESLAVNPFGVVAMVVGLALVVAVARARIRRAPQPDLDVLVRRPWALVLVGAWLAYSAVRLVTEIVAPGTFVV
ncbi:MAG: hypothetical protein CMH83_15540 [Nocardioides sp.]|nr:hypothetical protein [Nocardioides sp.]